MTARTHRLRRTPRLLAPGLAFLATLISLPGAAVNVPDVPLQSGAAYPPANIRFILDDSGSMEWDFMPGAQQFQRSACNDAGQHRPQRLSAQHAVLQPLDHLPAVDQGRQHALHHGPVLRKRVEP